MIARPENLKDKTGKQTQGSQRFAARLLFQFCHSRTISTARQLCEERIVLANAMSARDALKKFRAAGKGKQYSYLSATGETVRFRFVGIIQMLKLDLLCEDDEVWYELHDRLPETTRQMKLVRTEGELDAIKFESPLSTRMRDKETRRGSKRGRAKQTP